MCTNIYIHTNISTYSHVHMYSMNCTTPPFAMLSRKIPTVGLPRAITQYHYFTRHCQMRALSKDEGAERSGTDVQVSPKYKALLVDAGGTLLQPSMPVEETYAAFGAKYGVNLSTEDIKGGFKRAFAKPWPERLRYEGDGKPFWRYAVALATGCKDDKFFEELYYHYSRAAAWKLPAGAVTTLNRLKNSGVKLGVISNFDSRLRPLLQELNIANLFHAVTVSCEVGYEKPNPQIFEAALGQLGVRANEAVLLGDDPIADKEAARAVGIDAWLWRKEVLSFEEVADKILESKTSD